MAAPHGAAATVKKALSTNCGTLQRLSGTSWRRQAAPLSGFYSSSTLPISSGGSARLRRSFATTSASSGSSSSAAGRFAGQLNDEPSSPSGLTTPQVLAANRDFLTGAAAGRQVLLHDYRDVAFLKKVTMIAVTGTLMSSSGLVYAISFGFSAAKCAFIATQTFGGALALYAYLRTSVARVVLDPRRSQLIITGCGLFGAPLPYDEQVPLDQLKPGYFLSDHYIEFKTAGSSFDPATWISFRMPRAPSGTGSGKNTKRKPGAHVGYRQIPTERVAESPSAASNSSGGDGGGRVAGRFPGAGFGGEPEDGFAGSRPRAPTLKVASKPDPKLTFRGPQKAITALKLSQGLPVSGAEEQKILDFLEDPTAYAAPSVS
eukprot:TRINITY_DN20763_c0_g1_i1.p1 TRINITY_DN20763_c0_g1~~TRINITY_DN20763_c0_g1_i1.p1  ORF type:complete len:374 (+),score=71.72 TRINITY_DN20763_c0_g1_i1:60-1181(+)